MNKKGAILIDSDHPLSTTTAFVSGDSEVQKTSSPNFHFYVKNEIRLMVTQ